MCPGSDVQQRNYDRVTTVVTLSLTLRNMQVCKEAGLYTDSFMVLQKLSKVSPDSPGLLQQLQQAADLCLGTDTSDDAQTGVGMCYTAL